MKVRIKDNGFSDKEITLYNTEVPNEVASFAMQLIDKHANVAGQEDGEDSQGRARLRLQTVEELVDRSFNIAARAYAVARERGLMIALPDINEVNKEYDAERAAERAATSEKKAAKRAALLENA